MAEPIKLSDLDLYLLKTNDPATHEAELVEKAFEFWQSSWAETFKSLNVDVGHHLYADDFLDRQAIALFDGTEPRALFFCHEVSLVNSQMQHSYFKNYPLEVLGQIKGIGYNKCMILSYMTVHPSMRKNLTDVPMYELLFSLGVKKFQTLPHECLLGYIRKDLSFHASFARHGGVKIAENKVYNVDVDYLYMTKETMRMSPLPGVAETANVLWEKMLFRNRRLQNQKLKAA